MPASEHARLPRLVAAIRSTPWAIEPSHLDAICEVIELRLSGVRLSQEEVEARISAGPGSAEPYASAGGGIAVLPVYGAIVPRANLMTEISGGTSLQKLGGALDAAAADPAIGTIVLDVNSPGGSVELVPETAAKIRAARSSKPVIAVANTMAASAAYWLASQADEVVVTPSGSVGSIGVISAHRNESAMWEQRGIETTLISAGRFKTEGHSYGPLEDEGREALQALVDDFYGQFVAEVAKGRGASVKDVRAGFGEGRLVWGRSALEAGMVDRVEPFDAVLARLARTPRRAARAAADDTTSPPVAAGGPPVPAEQPLLDQEHDLHMALRRRN